VGTKASHNLVGRHLGSRSRDGGARRGAGSSRRPFSSIAGASRRGTGADPAVVEGVGLVVDVVLVVPDDSTLYDDEVTGGEV
jgi:hypothetical protein